MFKAGWWVCAAAALEIWANAESGLEVLIPPFLAPPSPDKPVFRRYFNRMARGPCLFVKVRAAEFGGNLGGRPKADGLYCATRL